MSSSDDFMSDDDARGVLKQWNANAATNLEKKRKKLSLSLSSRKKRQRFELVSHDAVDADVLPDEPLEMAIDSVALLTEPNDNCRIPDIVSDDDSIVLHKSDESDNESPSESELPPFVPVFGPLI